MSPADGVRVGYVMKMYPRVSETFILTEILAHEAAGLDIDIFSLRPPVDGRFHEGVGRVRGHVTYMSDERASADALWSAARRCCDDWCDPAQLVRVAERESGRNVLHALLLAEAVRERGITHLHAHFATVATHVARVAALLAGVPFSFTAHAKDIFHESVDEGHLGACLRDAAGVVTVSDFNLAFLRERYGADAARVERIYNGLDLGEFPYEDPAERAPVIAGVGRLVEKKGFADLVEARALLARSGRDFRCEIVGDGALRGDLEAAVAARDLGDRVTFLGQRPRHDVIDRVRRAAVLAAPCVVADDGNRDGLPTVLIEAMALGTPCISTPVTGIPEIVRDGETGVLVPERDPAALAGALGRLLDDAGHRSRLAEGGRALVESEFDIHANTAAMRRMFAPATSPKLQVG